MREGCERWARVHETLERGDVGGQHQELGLGAPRLVLHHPAAGVSPLDATYRRGGVESDAPSGEPRGERLPDGPRERPAADVEDQALQVPGEVEVEHHQQLGGGHLGLGVEERVREDVEEHPPRGERERERVEIRGGAHPVEACVGALRVEAQHLERGAGVGAHDVGGAEVGRLPCEREDLPGRPLRQATEALHHALRSEDGVVLERGQEARAPGRSVAAVRAGCSTGGRRRGSRAPSRRARP